MLNHHLAVTKIDLCLLFKCLPVKVVTGAGTVVLVALNVGVESERGKSLFTTRN